MAGLAAVAVGGATASGVAAPCSSARPLDAMPEAARGAVGRIAITEVMYNPASGERRGESEWVELCNVGTAPMSLSAWRLDDEDTRRLDDWGTFSVTLAPGEVAVLINGDAVDEAQFRRAWDDPERPTAYTIVPISWGGISNNPSLANEVLQLLDGEGVAVAEVNLRRDAGWPRLTAAGGPSVYLTAPTTADPNDGTRWLASTPGVAGAVVCRQTAVFDGRDIGSPGTVPAPQRSPGGGPITPSDSPPQAESDRVQD